jgi:hypothetical protein
MIGRLLNHKGAKSRSITSKHYNHALYLRERLEMLQAWERKLRNVLGLPARSASGRGAPFVVVGEGGASR